MMDEPHEIVLTVNGVARTCQVEARRTLADALRHDLQKPGTHLGCEHGICGACTVILDGSPVRSCLVFAVQADGGNVETVEGLAQGEELNSLQEAFALHHGLQCGFCTPGFLMLFTAYLRERHTMDADQLREVAASNLCRCTGYQGIIASFRQEAIRLGHMNSGDEVRQ
jgi:aerobic-type carbon monoxide dehydrogenase small subunit (CoxS/CutS family)